MRLICYLIKKNKILGIKTIFGNHMSPVKKYIWAIPFISGLFGLLGVLTPAIFLQYFVYIWNWGLVLYTMFGTSNYYSFINDNQMVLNTGIIVSVLFFVISVVLIISSYRYKNYIKNHYKVSILWIICGICFLFGFIS